MRNTASTTLLPKPQVTYGAIVGGVIERRRTRLGLKQQVMASALSLTQPAYSRIESGESSMNLTQLRIIADQLGTTPSALTGEADQLVARLRAQGVEVKHEKEISPAAILIGLAILAALIR